MIMDLVETYNRAVNRIFLARKILFRFKNREINKRGFPKSSGWEKLSEINKQSPVYSALKSKNALPTIRIMAMVTQKCLVKE